MNLAKITFNMIIKLLVFFLKIHILSKRQIKCNLNVKTDEQIKLGILNICL